MAKKETKEIKALKLHVAELKRAAQARRLKKLQLEGERRLAKEPNKQKMTDTEYAMWFSEKKEKSDKKPTRIDPIDTRKIGWAE